MTDPDPRLEEMRNEQKGANPDGWAIILEAYKIPPWEQLGLPDLARLIQTALDHERQRLAEAVKWQNQNAAAAVIRDEELREAQLTIAQLTEERDTLQQDLWQWEAREATICPENVGFEELISVLRKELAEARAAHQGKV